MELQQYQALKEYLEEGIYPSEYNNKQQQKLKTAAQYFKVENNKLYHLSEEEPEQLQRVIKITELETILYNTHDNPLSGHLKFEATYNRIKSKYFWYNMQRTIKEYIRNCEVCQREGRRRRNEVLRPIQVTQPFGKVGIDIVGPLPKTTESNQYIVTAMDYLTKWPEARAIPDATAKSVANFLYEDIICRHGCPQELVSDNGSAFISQVVEAILERHQVKHRLISPYHPQSNGLVERFNRTLCSSLAKYVQVMEEDWDKFLPSVLFAYRTMRHNTTKFEPFSLVYGRSAITPLDLLLEEDNLEKLSEEEIEKQVLKRTFELIDTLEPTIQAAKKNIESSQQKQKEKYPVDTTAQQFNEGELVLKFKHTKEERGKFQPKWTGPYTVYKVYGNGAYKLRTMDGRILKSSTNGNDLRSYQIRNLPEPMVVIEQ
jgi:hypothetical protein